MAAALATALGTAGIGYAQEDADGTPPPPPPKEMEHDGKDWHPHDELMELLPDDRQKILKDAFEKMHADDKASFEQGRKLHEELDAILKAPKFDEDAFLKKSDEIDALHTKMWQEHQKAVASVAAKFTPEERRVLLVMGHMMMHPHAEGGWHHHGMDMHPPQQAK
jgi:Spy/CpxP family protein refolding chaperone